MMALLRSRRSRTPDRTPDEDAIFVEAAREAFPRLVRYARAIVRPSQAEDVAQDALTKAWRYFDSYDGSGSFEGWLFRICRRCALDVVARDASRPMELHGLVPPEPRNGTVPAGPDSAVGLELLVDMLPEVQREAFALTQIGELTYEEAAEVLEVPVGTIRSRVNRARAFLQERLADAEAS